MPVVIDSIYYTLVEQIKNEVIDVLRDVFSTHPVWTYVASPSGGPDYDNSKILISDIYPLEARLLPAITVSFTGGTDKVLAFNQNRWLVKYDPDTGLPLYYEFNGAWNTTALLTISCEDTITREQLTSYISHLFMHFKRRYLSNKGVFIKNVGMGSETEEPYANDYLYLSTVTLEVYSEWNRKYPLVGAATVETIVFKDDTEGVLIEKHPPMDLVLHFGLEGVGPHYEEEGENYAEHGTDANGVTYGPGYADPYGF